MDIYLPYIPQVISSLLFCAAFTLHICNGNRPRLASALIDCGSMALILARCIADGGVVATRFAPSACLGERGMC